MRHPEKAEWRPDRIPDVRYSGGMTAEENSGCEAFGWNDGGNSGYDMFEWNGGGKVPGVMYPGGMAAGRNSG